MSDEIALLSATELLALYRTKALSPVEAVEACLARIERYNATLIAFRVVAADEALAAARESEARWMRGEPLGLLDGVPTSIKDSHDVKGWTTLHGSLTMQDTQPAGSDAPHVARLREHGAIFLGKTTLCEFGWKCVTDSPLTGVTRNPWNHEKTASGSSGGAVVSAATGMAAINMGGDGGGSIRAPAAFCGVFGIKPTYGRVPRFPAESFIACAHFGPLTRSVGDAALAMTVITGPDHRDAFALPYDGRDYSARLDGGVKGLRIAYSADLGYLTVDPEVASIVAAAVKVFEDLGAVVDEANPGLGDTFAAYKVMNSAYQVPKIRDKTAEQIAMMDPVLVANARVGETLSAFDLLEAGKVRADMAFKMAEFHRRYDLLITPTLPVPAFDVGRNNPSMLEEAGSADDRLYCLFNHFLYQVNYTHQPAASLPCGFTHDGLPVGLQIIGPRFSDHVVLAASCAFETIAPFRMPGPPQLDCVNANARDSAQHP
ncbi:MAG TPA: amidase [Kiloniellaceae bacterium]|nr:amidase [Kiloniellaceae bacterium]